MRYGHADHPEYDMQARESQREVDALRRERKELKTELSKCIDIQVIRKAEHERDAAVAELKAAVAALKEIGYHGISKPIAADYSEEVWWKKIAMDCMRIANNELNSLPGGGESERCEDCDGTGWIERAEGPKDTDVGVVRPLKCATCHGSGRLDGGVLKELSFNEHLVFLAACRGVGTFRLGSFDEEIRVLKEVYAEVCEAHGRSPADRKGE